MFIHIFIYISVIRTTVGKKNNQILCFMGSFIPSILQRNANKHTSIKDVLALLNYMSQPTLVILTAKNREMSEKYEL